MGRDKALLRVDGQPMVRRVAVALQQAGASRVVTIGGDQAGLTTALRDVDPDVATLPDDTPGEGPLGGVVTALRALGSEIVLVLACDLLAPSPTAMATTVATLTGEPTADLAAPVRGDQVEWLHAAWRGRARPRLAEQFATGERAIHAATRTAGLTLVAVQGQAPAALADADTPSDLPRASEDQSRQ